MRRPATFTLPNAPERISSQSFDLEMLVTSAASATLYPRRGSAGVAFSSLVLPALEADEEAICGLVLQTCMGTSLRFLARPAQRGVDRSVATTAATTMHPTYRFRGRTPTHCEM